jgi:cell division protease FtsH
LIFAKVSTGASDDIQKATDLADRFVTLYGMSRTMGPIAYEKTQQPFLDGITNPHRAVSPKVMEAIDAEVRSVVDSAHQMALLILSQNRSLLQQLAQLLLDQEVVEGDQLRACLNAVQRPIELDAWLKSGQIEPGAPRPESSVLGNGQRVDAILPV